jgi:hypothetical protein
MAPVPAFTGDLRTKLVRPPDGSTDATDLKTGGTVDIDQAAASFPDKTQGKSQLQSLGFKAGAVESWKEPGPLQVTVVVFQFGDHQGATTFTFGAQSNYTVNTQFDTPIMIPGVPLGNVYQQTKAGPDNNYLTEVFFTKNNMSVELKVTGPVKVPSDGPISLAQTQYALLP